MQHNHSGATDGVHLHFELYLKNRQIDLRSDLYKVDGIPEGELSELVDPIEYLDLGTTETF